MNEKAKLQARQREITDRLSALAQVQGRELTDAEKAEEASLNREFDANDRELRRQSTEEKLQREAPKTDKDNEIRELLKEGRHGHNREIIVGTAASPGAGLDSGAIATTIHDLVPNLEEGTGLPSGLQYVEGVTGNDVWPTDASDMEIEVAGEIQVKDDQVIDFDNVKASPERVTLSCDVSNRFIDNVKIPILPHIQKKFAKAWRKFCARRVYTQAAFTDVVGGFGDAEVLGTITLGGDSAAQILAAIAEFVDKGFDTESLCLTIDAVTEARLKTEPIQRGAAAGFIIQGGKLLGYDYTVSHHINTVLGGDPKTSESHSDTSKIYKTTDRYLGIGFYEYLKFQQHGEWRMGIDGTSKAQMKKNCVGVVLNTEVSLTDLSQHIYDEDGNAVSAFGVYKFAEVTPSAQNVKIVNDGDDPVIVSGGVTVDNTAGSPVIISGGVTVDNTEDDPVNTKEVSSSAE